MRTSRAIYISRGLYTIHTGMIADACYERHWEKKKIQNSWTQPKVPHGPRYIGPVVMAFHYMKWIRANKNRNINDPTTNSLCCSHFSSSPLQLFSSVAVFLFSLYQVKKQICRVLGFNWRKMQRRNVRLRREYLYRKSLEGKERLHYEKKRKLNEALQGDDCCYMCTLYISFIVWSNEIKLWCFHWVEGKPIPTELRNEEAALRQEIDLEDEHTAGNHSSKVAVRVCVW